MLDLIRKTARSIFVRANIVPAALIGLGCAVALGDVALLMTDHAASAVTTAHRIGVLIGMAGGTVGAGIGYLFYRRRHQSASLQP